MTIKKETKSALTVNKGIEQPSVVNDNYINKYKKIKIHLEPLDYYINGILEGSITHLSRAITLIESTLPEHQTLGQQIVEKCTPYSCKSLRIGITGVPGVGKSTFIEALGKHITSFNHKLAVLAVDPSSERSKGSILGDKTRMEELSIDPLCYIRPSPAAGSLGGVARKTRETIILCEAAGYDIIIVETVGVGQSETTVKSMVDFFLLLMLAGAGDELQGIKRGIMEMADLLVINKADKDNLRKAQLAKGEYQNALRLFPPTDSGWEPIVEICSALTKTGINDIWQIILNYQKFTLNNQFFFQNRTHQLKKCLEEAFNQVLMDKFYNNQSISAMMKDYEKSILNGHETPYTAAEKIFNAFYKTVTK